MKIIKDTFRENTGVVRFLLAILFIGLSHGLYRGIQDNYFAEMAHIDELERGAVEFFRELPGLFLVFILAIAYKLSEVKIFRIGTALMLCALIGFLLGTTDKIYVTLCTVLYSLGEHIIMPIKSSLSIEYAKSDRGGTSLGIMTGITNVGNIVGFVIVTGIFFIFSGTSQPIIPFKIVFALATALTLFASLITIIIKENGQHVKRPRLYVNKKFKTFYILEMFYGARKQIFLTFGPYVLILHYGADTATISLLLAISAGCCIFFSPIMGRIIDKLGYKVVMIADTLILVGVCLLYGFSHRLFSMQVAFYVVCTNYVLDTVISIASMASNMYANDLSDSKEEFSATLTTGISVNHLMSVAIALAGGWIWRVTGIETLFTLSAILGVCNSIYAAMIKVPKKNQES